MKFIRHLLSHGLLLTFIIALVGAYYYRAVIFSEEVNAKINGGVNSALVALTLEPMKTDVLIIEEESTVPVCDTPVETVVDEIVSDLDVVVINSEIVNEDVEVGVEVEKTVDEEALAGEDVEQEVIVLDSSEEIANVITDTDVEKVDVEIKEENADTTIEDSTDSAEQEIAAGEVITEATTDEAPSVIEFSTHEIMTNEEQDDAKAVMENIPVDPHFDLLNQARFAHQIGNDFNAIELYRELIQTYPDDPNVYGELGNVYYSKGKWKQASQAYYEAAVRLHKIDKTEQINYLMRVIEGLDPKTAKKLNDQLGR